MCAVCDSDYFSFSPEVILDKTGNALEGDTVSFILYGSVVGDPEIRLTDIALAPGQTGGFVGDGVGTPELGTFSLFGGGLVITLSSRLRLKWRKWTNAS
jgi:hypothetical protein